MQASRVRTETSVFLLVAFGFSWASWIPLALAGTTVRAGEGWPSHLPGLLGPALGAFAAVFAGRGRAGVIELCRRMIRWRPSRGVVLVLSATVLVAISATVIGAARGGSTDYSGAPAWGVLTVLYVLVVNGYGEETGWRGYLGDTLVRRTSKGVAAFIVWFVWGLWHIPLFFVVENFRELGLGGIIGWAIGLLSGSIVLLWMYLGAGRSILVVALWHTAFNYTAATGVAAGVIAAVSSTAVIVLSIPIIVRRSWWTKPGALDEQVASARSG